MTDTIELPAPMRANRFHDDSEPAVAPMWYELLVPTLADAEDFLDSLEAWGVTRRKFSARAGAGFVVRWYS